MSSSPPVVLFDTTLRDGAQAEGISFSPEDKEKIVHALDDLGIHYIEAGWPGSNPKDDEFFRRLRRLRLKQAKIVAFGSTRRKGIRADRDPNLRAILRCGAPVACIFGKSWGLHVRAALRTTPQENLRMISDSVRFLKRHRGVREVVYDAEHYFDGYRQDPAYALATIQAAAEAGADWIVLCDTNGGRLPHEIAQIVEETRAAFSGRLGIHAHNDAECAVANSLAAVRAGCAMVQGTLNGIGERCGNACLASVAANLVLKMGIPALPRENLRKLTETWRYVEEVANLVPNSRQPYVGTAAFAHKGGVHVSGVARNTRTYEHVPPDAVGNRRRILLSELSGKATVLWKTRELKMDFLRSPSRLRKILSAVKQQEQKGYEFEGAEGSFALLARKALNRHRPFFELLGFHVSVEKDGGKPCRCEASIRVRVDGREEHTAALGDGPVNALDNALRKALEKFYPSLAGMSLSDFKVRVINADAATAAKVRVFIESRDARDAWGTVGVSENILEASWQALADSIEYKLLKDAERRKG